MIMLRSSNCDNPGGCIIGSWPFTEPTREQLAEVISGYGNVQLDAIVDELYTTDECHVFSADCTVYKLERI